MFKRNVTRILGAVCVAGMLLYLLRDQFTPREEGYEYVASISVFSTELLVFMVVTSVGCVLLTHGFGRLLAIAMHVLGRGDAAGPEVIAEDIQMLAYISKTVMGVGRLALLLGVVIALRNMYGGYSHPPTTFAMALLPILYASALGTLVIGPATETLRTRLEGTRNGSCARDA